MSPQLDLIPTPRLARATRAEARARRELGMQRVGDKAERCEPGWTEEAMAAVRRYVATQHALFTVELMRMVLEAELPPVHDRRAWGVVTVRAIKEGLIERVKGQFFPAVSSNNSPKCVYRRGPKA